MGSLYPASLIPMNAGTKQLLFWTGSVWLFGQSPSVLRPLYITISLALIIILNLTRSATPHPAMEASASSYASAPAALLPLLAAPPRFLHLPLRRPSARRHGFASGGGRGLLFQPPLLGPGSRARCRTTCCASSPEQAEVLLGGASLVCLAAVALLTALQLIWLRWRSARHGDFPEVNL